MAAIYAAVIGGILGVSEVAVRVALPVLAVLVLLRTVWDIAVRKHLTTGTPSHYALYLENLRRAGNPVSGAWRAFLAQSLAFHGGLGVIVYALARTAVQWFGD
jgi:hypothetical protein